MLRLLRPWLAALCPFGVALPLAAAPGASAQHPVRDEVRDPKPEASHAPADWIALGRRLLGTPYTPGGATPLGFDGPGLVWYILERHGIVLARTSPEMCFREPRLVAAPLDDLQQGDLLFFGSQDEVDHVGMWVGDGTVLEATTDGVPSTQVTDLAKTPLLKGRLRYARRLADLPGARRPGGLAAPALAALDRTLRRLAADGAGYGIYFKDLEGGGTIRIAADRPMHAASTMKTPVLLEVLRQVDAGSLRLADELPVKNEFASVVDGSPFSIGLEPDSDGPTQARLGGTATLEFLIREMIVRSSNLATNIVLSRIGPETVQRFVDALGAPTVKVRRCLEDGKAFEKGLNNETDADGMGVVLEAARRSRALSEAARAKAWEILTGQVFNEQIPAGIPSQAGVLIGHKTGSISSVQHDTALVRLPDGREYVLVLLATDFGADEAGRQRVYEQTRRMSRAVWEAMIAPQ